MSESNKKIVLLDAYCPTHVGNDVLLESSMRIVNKMFPDYVVSVHAKTPSSFTETQGIACKQRLFSSPPRGKVRKSLWAIGELTFMATQILNAFTFRITPHRLAFGVRKETLRDYSEADVAISIGGELISDTFWKVLPLHLHMFWLAKQSGAKTVIFPQSIGPLRKAWTRRLVRYVFSRCDIVTGRDEPAIKELGSLGVLPDKVLFSPDVGVGQPSAPESDARSYLENLGVEFGGARKWIGITCSAGSPEVKTDGFAHIQVLAQALIDLNRDLPIGVVILPANMPVDGDYDSDYRVSSRIYEQLKTEFPCFLAPPRVIPASIFKASCKLLDGFVSTRMHAAILSTLAPVPTITINTQRKLLGYMTLIGQQRYAVDVQNITPVVLHEMLVDMLQQTDDIRSELISAREERLKALDDYASEVSRRLKRAA